jgi:hypothetical protein
MDDASRGLAEELERIEEDSTLATTIRQNIGKYLKETLVPQGPIAGLKHFASRKIKLRPEQFMFKRDRWAVRLGRTHIKFDTEAAARTAYKELLSEKKAEVIKKLAAKRGVSPEDLKKLAARGLVQIVPPLTEPQRIRIKQSRDPRFTWAVSYMDTVVNTENLRFFRKVGQKFGRSIPKDIQVGGDKAIAEWAAEGGLVEVKGSPLKVGILSGKYLPKEIGRDVNEMSEVPSTAKRIYLDFLMAWKSSKTIYNVPTHFRNVFGNVMFSDLAGNNVLDLRNAPHYIAAMKDLIAKGPNWRELTGDGVVGGEYFGNEVRQALRLAEKTATPDTQLVEAFRYFHEKAGRLYNAEDQIYKIAAYIKYKKAGMAPAAASRRVNEWFPNYAELPRWVRTLSRTPIGGPFLAFNVSALRIGGRAAIRHPFKLAKWAAVPGALTALSKMYLGMSDDEEELVDAGRSYFEPVLPVRDKRGAAETLDLRYIIPMANEINETFRGHGVRLPFLLQQPPLSGVADVVYNKDLFRGKPIWNPTDTRLTKMKKGVLHLLKETAPVPGMATYGRDRVRKALAGESEDTVVKAIAGALFGINIRKAYVGRRDAYAKLKALTEQDRAVERVMDRLLRGRIKSMSYKSLQRNLARNERLQDLLDIYNETYRRLGSPDRKPTKEITTKGLLQSIRHDVAREREKRP